MRKSLDFASRVFPGVASRTALLLRLAEEGERSLRDRPATSADERAAAKARFGARGRALTADQAQSMLDARERDWDRALPEH